MPSNKILLRVISTRDVLVPGPMQKMTFRREAEIEMQDPVKAMRDPRVTKLRDQMLVEINKDIAKIWHDRLAPVPKLGAGDLTVEFVANKK